HAVFVADTEPATLAAALRAVLQDPQAARARADRAYSRLCAHFTWQAVFATMMETAQNAKL
ncbi:MAG: glycosyltransferase, partial [Blautia massiliensis (ex Durand et al. 2017)]